MPARASGQRQSRSAASEHIVVLCAGAGGWSASVARAILEVVIATDARCRRKVSGGSSLSVLSTITDYPELWIIDSRCHLAKG